MDKSKIGAIAILVALGAGLFFSKSQDPPAPGEGGEEAAEHADADGHDHAKPASKELTGGVTKLKIEDERPGTGKAAASGDHLKMNYKGTLLNGEMFDQSYGKEPFEFNLGQGEVIKGWDEGIKGMKEGGKRKLTIPASLGYGERGAGEKIPGGATLVFEVELLEVRKR
jgi:FKBP-type peptidyl-prolyl cis-trans isomerase